MIVISIGTDRKIFDRDSDIRQRVIEYGQLVEEMHIIVFNRGDIDDTNNLQRLQIANNVFVYPTNSYNRLFYIFDAVKIFRKIIKNLKSKIGNFYDEILITVQDPFECGLVGVILKLFYGLPLQIQLHTDFYNRYFALFSLSNFLRFVLAHFTLPLADGVRVVSLRIKESIKEFNKNIFVLPVQNKKNLDYRFLEKEGFSSLNILTVCRIEKEKDLKTAVKAFGILSKKIPEATFTICGEGRERKNIERLCSDLRILKKVSFAGWQNNLEPFYKNSSVYLSTSLYEGYGMAVLEAGLSGLSLVLSDTGIANEIFKDRESALICKQKDVNCFASSLEKIILDNDLKKRMAVSAKEAALKSILPWDEYLKRYKESFLITIKNYKRLSLFKRIINLIYRLFDGNKILRFFTAGCFVAFSQLFLLYLLTEKLKIWYLFSSVLAFIYAVILSFLLQKFWAFRDKKTSGILNQFLKFLLLAVSGIIFNTLFMYFFVEVLDVWYILSQIFSGIIIMVINFLFYKFFIFK